MAKEKLILDLDVLGGVHGGALPAGWESGIDDYILMYKAMPEEAIGPQGLSQSVDDAVRFAVGHMKDKQNASPEECAMVESYIRSHW